MTGTTGGGHPEAHDGERRDEPEVAPPAPSGVSGYYQTSPMITLTVPLGQDRGDFKVSLPVYNWEPPTLDATEAAIRHIAEQAIRKLRDEQWLWTEGT